MERPTIGALVGLRAVHCLETDVLDGQGPSDYHTQRKYAPPPYLDPLRVLGREWEKSLQIIQGDVLKVPLPFFDVLVANVPYNVSARAQHLPQLGVGFAASGGRCRRHESANTGSYRERCANERLAVFCREAGRNVRWFCK